MTDTILVLNAGSSSIKFKVFALGGSVRLQRVITGQIEGIGVAPRLRAHGADGAALIDQAWPATEVAETQAALRRVVDFLRAQLGGRLPVAVGHRVVHGGTRYSEPTVLTEAVVRDLEPLIPLAPLHLPSNLAPIRVLLAMQPQILQVACFDTAFHRGHPELADRYALPESLYDEGVRRYGFHGLSYDYITSRLPDVAPALAIGKVIIAHLGSGASLCAVKGGRSIESTMGFTALDGLPMGTRPGQLDAGVVLYLLKQKGMSADEIEHLFYHDCGLKGLSGISNDVRVLIESTEPAAKLALDYFVYRIALLAGSLAAAMNGVDGIVFTAGIGENAPTIREAVIKRMGWLGFEIDAKANRGGGPQISSARSPHVAYVIPTDEELMIARYTSDALGEGARKRA
ncbi:MAG: acetate/propionate family kinase [Hyphomicrobium sp.]|jgi:acetate kinase